MDDLLAHARTVLVTALIVSGAALTIHWMIGCAEKQDRNLASCIAVGRHPLECREALQNR